MPARQPLIRQTENGEKIYETKQYYKSTGEYRLELTAPETVAGNYTVFDGDRICQYNPRVNDRIIRDVPESQHRSELFLGQFIRNYMQSERVSVETASFDSSKCVVLEAVIPGNDDGLATEKLWIDRESLLPSVLSFMMQMTRSATEWTITNLPSIRNSMPIPSELRNKHPCFCPY